MSHVVRYGNVISRLFHIRRPIVKLELVDRVVGYDGMTTSAWVEGRLVMTIKLATHRWLHYAVRGVAEYRSFNEDSLIGGFHTEDWQLALEALVIHEMAHVAQFTLQHLPQRVKGQSGRSLVSWDADDQMEIPEAHGPYEGQHGRFFRWIYGELRRRFNERVTLVGVDPPQESFHIPCDFEERLQAMPPSELTGISYQSNGRRVTVAGRNPNANRIRDYVVRDDQGCYFRTRMSIIASRSPEAQEVIRSSQALREEFRDHVARQEKLTMAGKKAARTRRRP
jgi:hypothetical protein